MRQPEFITLLAKRRTGLLHEARYLLLGLVALAGVSALYFWLSLPLVPVAFTYLIVLVLLALVSSFSSLIVLSFIAVGCLSYFFASPIYSFSQVISTITAFLITSLIVNFLITKVRAEQRNLVEAMKQQTATSEVMRIISNSPIQSVLDAVAENAARLCEANNAEIFRLENNLLRLVASYGEIPVNIHAREGIPANRDRVIGRATCDRRTIQVDNLAAEDSEFPAGSEDAKREGHRTTLATPLLREGVPVGVILIRRWEIRPFHAKQIALLENFADQAVIAIENARLFEAEKQRSLALVQANRELAEREAELARVSRVTTLGQLTASIAHEVTQPIASSRNNARAALNFLDRQPPDLGEVKEALKCVLADADRAGDIVDRIRDHFKKAPPRKGRFDLNKAINEVIALAESAITTNGVSVRTRLAEAPLPVQGDRVQLQQVVLNLILNAVEAMSTVEAGPRELLISTEQGQTSGVLVAVRDSGPGIDPEHLERVFEAFYTTKSSGVGMGLSICRSIIEAHGGRLWADANEPRGAVFQFTLPSAEKLMNSLRAARQNAEPHEDTVLDARR